MRTASRAPVRGAHGMVVSTSPIASDVGIEIMKNGGNAVDAAVAVGFALAVTHPGGGNIGGGGFLVFHDAASGESFTYDYREVAPARAHLNMYVDEAGEIVPGLSTVGHLSAGVPGTVAGLLLALEKHGRLVRQTVLAPAIRLAEEGFPVSYALSESLKAAAPLLSRSPESRRIFLRNGNYFEEGEILVQKSSAPLCGSSRSSALRGSTRGRSPRSWPRK